METQQIISKIQTALKTNSEKFNIQRDKVKFRIKKPAGFMAMGVACDLMDGEKICSPVKIADLFALNSAVAFLVESVVKDKLQIQAEANGLNGTANARIYAADENFYPAVDLYDGDKFVKKISIEELT